MMMKTRKAKIMMAVVSFIYVFLFVFTMDSANAEAKVTWSKVQKGSYNDLSPYTLNWTGNVLAQGGYRLADMDVTTSSKDADFIITQSGYIAANGIIKLNEQLQDETNTNITKFNTYEQVTQGAVYLIITSDGTWVKLKIDTVIKSYMDYLSKVTFSYVVEDEIIEEQPNNQYKPGQFAEDVEQGLYDENPFANPLFDMRYPGAEYTFEEGPIIITFPALEDQIAFDVYRSDNGGPYVPVSDFILEEPEFTDYYAFADHTYLYIFVAYDRYGVSEIDLPIKVNIVPANSTLANDQAILMKVGSTSAQIGDKKVTLDVAPVIVNGRTLVPVRFISEALGAEVGWEGETRTVTIQLGDKKITLQLDSSAALVNNKKVMLDVPAVTMNDRTMVPIRFVSENLDLQVEFNSETYEITIWSDHYSDTPSIEPDATRDQPSSEFVGIWDMWIPTGDPYVRGTSGGTLIIYEDMTWENINMENGKVMEGVIHLDESGRFVLLHYLFDWDWYVTATDEGIRISSPPSAYQVGTPVK